MHCAPASSRPAARETLLCLHCSASSGRQWNDLVQALAGDCDVLAPDLLGYGSAPGWQGGAVTLGVEADAVIALLDARREPVHLLGHSYGGAVALDIAMRRPDLVKSLTVFEPVRLALLREAGAVEVRGGRDAAAHDDAATETDRLKEAAAARDLRRFASAVQADVAAGALPAAAERFIDFWSAPGTWARMSVSRRDAIVASMAKVSAEFGAIFADEAQREDYRRLTMPVLLLGGGLSPAPMVVVLERLQALLPTADRMRLDGVGHMGPLQAPAPLASLLRGVIAGVRAADLAFSSAPSSAPPARLRLAA